MNLLHELNRIGALRVLDDSLAQTLRRLDPTTPNTVLAAAALASLAVANGHAALALAQPQRLLDAPLPWPDADTWQQQLQDSSWVVTPESMQAPAAAAPLVLENGLLYLRRYREYERRLAQRLTDLSAQPMAAVSSQLQPLFAQLFPQGAAAFLETSSAVEDRQAQAAALAMRRALLLITGGPGTGKTTTIAKLLVLRIAQAAQAGDAPLRIALAAPTGRAADRMAESLQRARLHMRADGIAEEFLAALPTSASTLHRLLGVIPDSPQFRHNADNPLPFDIVVVDEASMVDLPLMCKLTEAVATGAQLILLGDPDQLPSVEAGDVLASMLHMQPCRVHLTRGWRQSDTLHLAPLADAMRRGDADATLALLRGETLSNVHYHDGATDPLSARGLDLIGHYRRLATHTDPAQALAQANQVRLLTALRDGPQGARGLNARIEAQLTGQHFGKPPAWFPGRLILMTENSYRHGLFNGDVGICLADDAGQACVWFAGSDGVRGFHPASLPTHESAFAMTVHKAQGSEFEHVVFQLPTRDAKVLTRELLYTAITRARSVLHMAGSAEVIRTALARHSSRISGLAARLA